MVQTTSAQVIDTFAVTPRARDLLRRWQTDPARRDVPRIVMRHTTCALPGLTPAAVEAACQASDHPPSWPASVRWHDQFAYVSGELPDGTTLPLMRLRYADSASTWGFAIYRASHVEYEKSFLPSGWPAGTPQEPLDCAWGLYLNDTTAWLTQQPPTN